MAGLPLGARRAFGRSSNARVSATGSRQTIVQLAQKISRVVTWEPSGRCSTTGWNTVPLQIGQQMKSGRSGMASREAVRMYRS